MQKTKLTFWQMWNISFGFFGVQIAYSLQSANISRIFATLGADPHDLSFFWILPPLMGLIVQPLVGKYSDRTWTRLGRRIPYLFLGSIIAILVMCMLPNAGNFGLAVSGAMTFGLISLMFLDTSINVAMQPFKMQQPVWHGSACAADTHAPWRVLLYVSGHELCDRCVSG